MLHDGAVTGHDFSFSPSQLQRMVHVPA